MVQLCFHRVNIGLCSRCSRRVNPLWSAKTCVIYSQICFHVIFLFPHFSHLCLQIQDCWLSALEMLNLLQCVKVKWKCRGGSLTNPTAEWSFCSLFSLVVHRNVAPTVLETPQPTNCFSRLRGLISAKHMNLFLDTHNEKQRAEAKRSMASVIAYYCYSVHSLFFLSLCLSDCFCLH